MRTLVCTEPGHFEYRSKEDPIWAPGHTLLQILRMGVCGTDLHAFEGVQPYFEYPRILGHEIAARILRTEAVGFQQGEEVVFLPYFFCGRCIACRQGRTNCCATLKVCGVHIDGACSDYFLVPDEYLVHGRGLGADELALVEPFSIGAHAVKRAKLKEGQKVMVIGAGPIGLATMEMARMAGAEAAVCDVNNGRLDFCRKILDGNRVMNAGSSDLADRLKEWTGGDMPEVVFDASGNLNAIEAGFQYISYAGTYVLVGLQRGFIRFSHPEFHKRETTLMSSRNANRQDFEQVVDCMVKGFLVPGKYITHRLTFEHAGRDFGGLLDPKAGAIKALISFEI